MEKVAQNEREPQAWSGSDSAAPPCPDCQHELSEHGESGCRLRIATETRTSPKGVVSPSYDWCKCTNSPEGLRAFFRGYDVTVPA